MKAEDIQYDTPIEVTIPQYNNIMRKCAGIVAGRKADGKYYIKVLLIKYVDLVAAAFKL